MQAPGGPEEDTSGGFSLGGWTYPFFDEFAGQVMGEQMGMPFDLLLGRKTYDIFAAHWPKQTDPFAAPINNATKYVVTTRPVENEWKETVVVNGDVIARLHEIKQGNGPMLQIHGSSGLLQTLLKSDLVDELWLKTFPVTLGRGKRLFGEGVAASTFKLTDSKTSPLGVIIANYVRDGEVKTGSFAG